MDEMSDSTPRLWAELLDRSAADAAAGRIVSFEPVLNRLRASIARMEAKQKQNPPVPPET